MGYFWKLHKCQSENSMQTRSFLLENSRLLGHVQCNIIWHVLTKRNRFLQALVPISVVSHVLNNNLDYFYKHVLVDMTVIWQQGSVKTNLTNSEFHFLPSVYDFVTRIIPSNFMCHVLLCTCNDVSIFTVSNYLYRQIRPTNDPM